MHVAKIDGRLMKKIAVVGAGISGMSCARILLERGCTVELFDKGRKPGGRLATRVIDRDNAHLSFDHGAQYFTVKSDAFKTQVEQWLASGIVAQWHGAVGNMRSATLQPEQNSHERFVGVPSMRALAEYMAKDLDVATSCRVACVRRKNQKWVVHLENGGEKSDYDALVINTPPLQAVQLLPEIKALQKQISSVSMNPCWSTLVNFQSRVPLEFDGIFGDEQSPLSWVCRDSSKPGRAAGERWVLHASNDWSRNNLNESADFVSAALLKEFFDMLRIPRNAYDFVQSHRWLFAAPGTTDAVHDFVDDTKTLRICGDWCRSGRVEGAFLSGQETARLLLG